MRVVRISAVFLSYCSLYARAVPELSSSPKLSVIKILFAGVLKDMISCAPSITMCLRASRCFAMEKPPPAATNHSINRYAVVSYKPGAISSAQIPSIVISPRLGAGTLHSNI